LRGSNAFAKTVNDHIPTENRERYTTPKSVESHVISHTVHESPSADCRQHKDESDVRSPPEKMRLTILNYYHELQTLLPLLIMKVHKQQLIIHFMISSL